MSARGFERGWWWAALTTAALAACAPPAVGRVRFANQPIVWQVNDRRDVPQPPKETRSYGLLRVGEALVFRRTTHALELDEPPLAQDINALGEVPDSTWFTNRIGRRDLTVPELARGNERGGPVLTEPLRIVSSKSTGKSPGFIVRDARGTTFILKLELREFPVMETATDIIVQRLLWACGYHVPEDYLLHLRRDHLALADGAVFKGKLGDRRPLTAADVEDVLARAHQRPNGTYRAIASKYLAGRPLGGFTAEGTRSDDPNDVIPHEHRRSLRGLYVFFSWLQYTDVKLGNTLDMWVEDERHSGRHYVMHYLVDFGKSLGAFRVIDRVPTDGYAENLDYLYHLASVFTFGLWKRPWESVHDPDIEGVGVFDAEHYDPGGYEPHFQWLPFEHADVFDMFWAAKIVLRLSPELVRAAVEQGEFDDPRAAEYVTRVLLERRRKLGRHWLSRVNPLDEFRLEGGDQPTLCFDDLLVRYALAGRAARTTRYRATAYDFDGKRLAWSQTSSDTCVRGFTPPPARDGYTIVSIETLRGDRALAPVEVHLARAPGTGELRIIGLNRQ